MYLDEKSNSKYGIERENPTLSCVETSWSELGSTHESEGQNDLRNVFYNCGKSLLSYNDKLNLNRSGLWSDIRACMSKKFKYDFRKPKLNIA